MATVSLNGWGVMPTADNPNLRTGTVPGTRKRLTAHRVVLPLFLAVAHDIDRTVIDLDGGPLDGWSYRQARAADGWSNHASGSAFDFRYDVLKADHRRHMTTAQVTAMHRILDRYTLPGGRRVLGWGGDWKVGVYCDEMHIEVAQPWAVGAGGKPVTTTDIVAVIRRLGIQPNGTIKTAT